MGIHTLLDIESGRAIDPGATAMVFVRPQVSLRLHRLRIDPQIAAFFEIEDIKVGQRSAMPRAQSIPAMNFAHGIGQNFDAGIAECAMEVTMVVTNISNRHAFADNLMVMLAAIGLDMDVVKRLAATGTNASVPFRCQWGALDLSKREIPSYLTRGAITSYPPPGMFGASDDMPAEDLDSRIEHVKETVGKPKIERREHPGFGWDPYGDD